MITVELTVGVSIPDTALENAIRDELDLFFQFVVTLADMTDLTSLNAADLGITDLMGLETAVNLTFLDLSFNQISDLNPLSELTQLGQLWLDNNLLTDIGPLAGLIDLRDDFFVSGAGLRVQANFIDVNSGSAQRLIIDALDAIQGLTVEFGPQNDTDGDGMGDTFEQFIIEANPGDAIEDLTDVLPGDDFDGDGFTNLVEHFMGLNPLVYDSTGAFEVFDDGSFLTLGYLRSKVVPPAFGQVEWSNNLLDWFDTDITENVVDDLGDVEVIEATVPINGDDELFLRLVIRSSLEITPRD